MLNIISHPLLFNFAPFCICFYIALLCCFVSALSFQLNFFVNNFYTFNFNDFYT